VRPLTEADPALGVPGEANRHTPVIPRRRRVGDALPRCSPGLPPRRRLKQVVAKTRRPTNWGLRVGPGQRLTQRCRDDADRG